MLGEAIFHAYGPKEGLTVITEEIDGTYIDKITQWPYEQSRPTEEERAALIENYKKHIEATAYIGKRAQKMPICGDQLDSILKQFQALGSLPALADDADNKAIIDRLNTLTNIHDDLAKIIQDWLAVKEKFPK